MADYGREFQDIINNKNLAEDYDDQKLEEMGAQLISDFDEDEESRRPWLAQNARWMELATQVVVRKSWPWPDAANVKFPLLTTAAMQFAARSYPALVPGPRLVQGLVIGADAKGQHAQSADRVGRHMSYQLMQEMDNWEEDMDRLCITIPILGVLFKKTYRDPLKGQNVSELVFPTDLVVDYFAKSLETATRVSHVLFRTNNEIKERVNAGIWLDVDFGEARYGDSSVNHELRKTLDRIDGTKEPKVTKATPHKFIECHCWWDMDEDGYDEPYIVTVHYATKKIVRIVARFDIDGVKTEVDEKGKEKLVRIVPTEYFTKFGFIPNPDGGIYDLGFGLLLGGINEAVNTATNQLLDAGTLSNLQGGFLGRGIRVRAGGNRFQPGEWKPVDFTGDDIKKHIYPIPAQQPSDTLFKLLEALVTSGKELASVAEIFVGKMPGQNTPATTTMATIEQGLKVFTAIHKRLYRALQKEYKKLFKLNSQNLPDEQVYFTINEPEGPVSQGVSAQDYNVQNITVKPWADPNAVSQSQKLMKVQSYGPLLQIGTINPQEYTKRYLEAVEADNIQALMNVQPQPSPEEKQMQAELQMEQQKHQMEMQIKQLEARMEQQQMQMEMQFEQMKLALKAKEAQMDFQIKARQGEMDLHLSQQEHAQAMQINAESHAQEKQIVKEQGEMQMQKVQMQKKAQEQAVKDKGASAKK